MHEVLVNLAYLLASALFILGLKRMSHPRTAVQGNLFGAAGMGLAVAVTLLNVDRFAPLLIGAAIGTAIGALLAVRIQMTAMPQLVALFNGLGGIASTFVAAAELLKMQQAAPTDVMVATAASGMIGTVTFWGSLVAFGKLQGLGPFRKNLALPGQLAINGLLASLLLAACAWLVIVPSASGYLVVVLVATVLGLLLVMPIGGADMPVVIALLNSYSGLAAAATGFVIDNNVLIIAGSLVGASGLILTQIMCKAMNRSLANVLFGGMGTATSVQDAGEVYARVRSAAPEEIAMILDGARRVVVVPGYGMAVAQAQHAVRELANVLQKKGVDVEFAIHPVAGRMPGHMNVLLAEADVPYDKLKEMDEINPTMDTVDLAIVIGANDVVNPLARTDPNSPIYGMPIIDVDRARTVVVIKRSLSPGFAGIPNPLFAEDNTLMLFGDAKEAVLELIAALKEG